MEKTEKAEASMTKVREAEHPFLKGVEVLPWEEAMEAMKVSEAAAEVVKAGMIQARSFIAAKILELKRFDETRSKDAKEMLAQLNERIRVVSQSLSQYWKDTDSRKKTARLQEAESNLKDLVPLVEKAAEAVEPFVKGDIDKMSEDEASATYKKFSELEAVAQTKMAEVGASLMKRDQEARGNAALAKSVQALQARFAELRKQLNTAKRAVSDHEHKLVAEKLLSEVADLLKDIDAEVDKAKEACAPLVEQEAEKFLVAASVQLITSTLQDHMIENSVTEEALFKQVSGGKKTIGEKAFLAYLKTLPEAFKREEFAFAEERCKAICSYVGADKTGGIDLAGFQKLFRGRYTCCAETSVTDVFELESSMATGKLKVGEVVEAFGPIRKDESGARRLECSIPSTSSTGFVTLSDKEKPAYLKIISPFQTFTKEMDATMNESQQKLNKLASSITSKCAELPKATGPGSLADSHAELAKLSGKARDAKGVFRTLKTTSATAKSNYAKLESSDRIAPITAREKREAGALTGPAAEQTAKVEAIAKKMQEAVSPLASLKDPAEFATPATLLAEVEALGADFVAAAAEARALVKEQQAKVGDSVDGPMGQARRELGKMLVTLASNGHKSSQALASARGACAGLVEDLLTKCAAAFRDELSTKGVTVDELFAQLLKGGEEHIREATLCERLGALEGLAVQPEQAKLICRQIEAGRIGKGGFHRFLHPYFSVVNTIALTSTFDIGAGKTVRKAEAEELLVVLEGPRTDESLGVVRVRGRFIVDGKEGWVTTKGNQGTPYLREVEKPFYACAAETPLGPNAKGTTGEAVRTLQCDEVMEVLEGPRKEACAPALRVKAKAVSDSAEGWVTIQDKRGAILAQEGTYYKCKEPVSMTDGLEIIKSNIVRKLAVGEVVHAMEGPVEEKSPGALRLKGRSTKDGATGWMTVKGVQGTVYAEELPGHYTVLQDVPLQKGFASTAATVRMLAKDEAIHVTQSPKEEPCPPDTRWKGRALSDGAVGWFTVDSNMKPWSPYHRCIRSAPIHSTFPAAEGKALRELAVGESMELAEGPKLVDKEIWMKGSAQKDGATGWVMVRNSEGEANFEATSALEARLKKAAEKK